MHHLHCSRRHTLLALALALVLSLGTLSTPHTLTAQGPADAIGLQNLLTVGEGRYTALAISDDDRRLALGLATGEVHIYTLPAVDAVPDPNNRIVIEAHDSAITSLAFNGPTELASTATGENAVKIWNVQNRSLRVGLAGPAGSQVAFSPDGRWLALGVPNESKVDVLNAVSFQRQYVAETLETSDNDGILALTFSPDGQRLAFSTRNAGVFLVNVTNRTVTGNYVGPAPLNTLTFEPQTGSQLVGSVGAPTLSFVALDGFTLAEVVPPTANDPNTDGLYAQEGFAQRFSDDGAFRVGTANRQAVAPFGQPLLATFALLAPDAATTNFVVAGNSPALDVAVTSDARFIYGLTPAALYRVSTAPTEIMNGAVQPVPLLEGSNTFNAVNFSSDSQRVLVVDYNLFGAQAVEYDVATGNQLSTATVPNLGEIDFAQYATTLNQSNDLILRGHDQNDFSAEVITTTAGSVRLNGPSVVTPLGVVVSAEQTTLTLRERDPATQQFTQRSAATQFPVTTLIASADGNRFAALDDQQRIATFDVASASQITQATISTNVIDADGFALNLSGTQALAWGTNPTGQTTLALINVQNGSSIRSTSGVEVVAASADPTGTLFAVISADGQLRLLDANTLEERAALDASPTYTRLTWSPDGTRLALHGGPGILRVVQVTR
jgi:WD40 repeat protein